MTDPTVLLALAATALGGLMITTQALLKGWRGWLDLRRMEIEQRRPDGGAAPSTTSRIELADLKERVRKLEAIAAGVDL